MDDWLIQAPSQAEAREATEKTIALCNALGFKFNIPKSILKPAQTIDWLGMTWDARAASLGLSPANRARVTKKLRRMLLATTCTHRLWASLMGSLNFAAQVVPLGRLWCRRLWWEGNRAFSRSRPHQLRPLPFHLRTRLHQWVQPGLLSASVPWRVPPPRITVCTDASDIGWGYQADNGIQGHGHWSRADREGTST